CGSGAAEIQTASCVGSSCLICEVAYAPMSCSSILSGSGCRSNLLVSKQRHRASRKSQNRSLGRSPWAARTAASRNVVLKTSCALRESPSIKKQKRYSCGKFCFRSDTLQSFVLQNSAHSTHLPMIDKRLIA